MTAARCRLLVLGLACLTVLVMCGLRVSQVNAAYPERHVYDYSLGETATYAGQNSSGGEVSRGSVLVEALAFSMVDYGGLRRIVPEYSDEAIDERYSSEMYALLLKVRIKNASDDKQSVHMRDFVIESGAWASGLYAPLYASLNQNPSTIVDLDSGEEIERTLVYVMHDTEFNNRLQWESVKDARYDLVLALYPDKYQINIGEPGIEVSQKGESR